MRSAVYIEDGACQFVLTPETAFEREIVRGIMSGPVETRVLEGGFYTPRNRGWTQEAAGGHSLIVRLTSEPRPAREADSITAGIGEARG